MKIVYIHQYFKTPKDHGGTRSYHLAKAMVSSGHEVHLITSHNASEYKVAQIEGICVCYIPVPYRQEFSPLRKLRAHAHFAYHAYRKARALKNVDLIYATSTPLTVGLIALLLNKTKGTRYFFEVRDIWPEVPIALGMVKNRVTRQLLCRMTREIYRNASAVISLSPGITQLIDKYNTRTPVHELPNFSDTSLFRPLPPNQELKRTYLKEGEMGIVHFGAIGRINHLDYFLDAAGASKQAKLPLRFFIIGEGSEEKRLKKEAHLQDLDNVVFVPPVPKKRMPDWLSIMDFSYITVKNVPILSTNSANKLYDSLAAGKICITNIEGWMQQMVERERCGLNIDPLDPSAFVEQIRPFIENEHLRKQYAAHARAVSEKYYSAEIVSGNLLGILDSYSPEPRPEGNLIGEDPRYCHSAPDATSLPSPRCYPE